MSFCRKYLQVWRRRSRRMVQRMQVIFRQEGSRGSSAAAAGLQGMLPAVPLAGRLPSDRHSWVEQHLQQLPGVFIVEAAAFV